MRLVDSRNQRWPLRSIYRKTVWSPKFIKVLWKWSFNKSCCRICLGGRGTTLYVLRVQGVGIMFVQGGNTPPNMCYALLGISRGGSGGGPLSNLGGVQGSENVVAPPPPDKFWNSPKEHLVFHYQLCCSVSVKVWRIYLPLLSLCTLIQVRYETRQHDGMKIENMIIY